MNLLVLKERIFVLFNKVYKTMVNWPKVELNGLQLKVKELFINIITNFDNVIEIKSQKVHYLKIIISNLRTLHTTLEFASRNKFISINFFKEVSIELNDVKEELIVTIK